MNNQSLLVQYLMAKQASTASRGTEADAVLSNLKSVYDRPQGIYSGPSAAANYKRDLTSSPEWHNRNDLRTATRKFDTVENIQHDRTGERTASTDYPGSMYLHGPAVPMGGAPTSSYFQTLSQLPAMHAERFAQNQATEPDFDLYRRQRRGIVPKPHPLSAYYPATNAGYYPPNQ